MDFAADTAASTHRESLEFGGRIHVDVVVEANRRRYWKL